MFSFFWRKGKTEEQQGVQTLAVTEGLVALYAEELLLDQFEFLNDYQQLVLQENKKSEDEHVQDANQTSPKSACRPHRKYLGLNRYQNRYWEWEPPEIDEGLTF